MTIKVKIPDDVVAVKNISVNCHKTLKPALMVNCDLRFCSYRAPVTGNTPNDYVVNYDYNNQVIPTITKFNKER